MPFRYLVMVFFALFFTIQESALANDVADYEKARKAAEGGQWEVAIDSLNKIDGFRCDAMCRYLFAVCYAKKYKYENAVKYSISSLKYIPPLSDQYRVEAKKILKWALDRLQSEAYSVSIDSSYLLSAPSTMEIDLKKKKKIEYQNEFENVRNKYGSDVEEFMPQYFFLNKIAVCNVAVECVGVTPSRVSIYPEFDGYGLNGVPIIP